MNTTIMAAVQVLERTERQLREQMQASAMQGDYETLILITQWAKKIAELATTVERGGPLRVAHDASPQSPKLTPRKLSKIYPKFFRNCNALVKIAWSKSENAEYEHRAATSVLDQVIKAIEVTAKRSLFSMDAVISNMKTSDGAEVPSYQSYLCLAWLRQEGLVVQHGRQGYSVRNGVQLSAEAQQRYDQLPDVTSRTPVSEEKGQ
jgi:hypothetical protein